MNTHIDHQKSDEERMLSVAEFDSVIKKKADLPIIFCGDFNTTPDTRVYKRMNALLDDTWKLIGKGEGPTIPAQKPNRRIDYIWISKNGPHIPVSAHVPETQASDHRPLVAEFKLK
jgi:endonuclease/exonuclease/phosphatase (EEP) superfamily protein YafD